VCLQPGTQTTCARYARADGSAFIGGIRRWNGGHVGPDRARAAGRIDACTSCVVVVASGRRTCLACTGDCDRPSSAIRADPIANT
jgi:hypothetical protein